MEMAPSMNEQQHPSQIQEKSCDDDYDDIWSSDERHVAFATEEQQPSTSESSGYPHRNFKSLRTQFRHAALAIKSRQRRNADDVCIVDIELGEERKSPATTNRYHTGANIQSNLIAQGDQSMPESKPTMLCLHGWRSNGEIAVLQLENLGLSEHFELRTLEGPFQSNAAADDGVTLLSSGPYYSWLERDERRIENANTDDDDDYDFMDESDCDSCDNNAPGPHPPQNLPHVSSISSPHLQKDASELDLQQSGFLNVFSSVRSILRRRSSDITCDDDENEIGLSDERPHPPQNLPYRSSVSSPPLQQEASELELQQSGFPKIFSSVRSILRRQSSDISKEDNDEATGIGLSEEGPGREKGRNSGDDIETGGVPPPHGDEARPYGMAFETYPGDSLAQINHANVGRSHLERSRKLMLASAQMRKKLASRRALNLDSNERQGVSRRSLLHLPHHKNDEQLQIDQLMSSLRIVLEHLRDVMHEKSAAHLVRHGTTVEGKGGRSGTSKGGRLETDDHNTESSSTLPSADATLSTARNTCGTLESRPKVPSDSESTADEPIAYDAVYGFSQGAAIVTILSCSATRRKLLEEFHLVDTHHRHRAMHLIGGDHHGPHLRHQYFPDEGEFFPWKFVVLGCAANKYAWKIVHKRLFGGHVCNVVSSHIVSNHSSSLKQSLPCRGAVSRFNNDTNSGKSTGAHVGTANDHNDEGKEHDDVTLSPDFAFDTPRMNPFLEDPKFDTKIHAKGSGKRSRSLTGGMVTQEPTRDAYRRKLVKKRAGRPLLKRWVYVELIELQRSTSSHTLYTDNDLSGKRNQMRPHRSASINRIDTLQRISNDAERNFSVGAENVPVASACKRCKEAHCTFHSSDHLMHVPSVHLMGVNDALKHESEFYYRLFGDDMSLPLYLDCGHEIPAFMKNKEKLSADVLEWRDSCRERHCLPVAADSPDSIATSDKVYQNEFGKIRVPVHEKKNSTGNLSGSGVITERKPRRRRSIGPLSYFSNEQNATAKETSQASKGQAVDESLSLTERNLGHKSDSVSKEEVSSETERPSSQIGQEGDVKARRRRSIGAISYLQTSNGEKLPRSGGKSGNSDIAGVLKRRPGGSMVQKRKEVDDACAAERRSSLKELTKEGIPNGVSKSLPSTPIMAKTRIGRSLIMATDAPLIYEALENATDKPPTATGNKSDSNEQRVVEGESSGQRMAIHSSTGVAGEIRSGTFNSSPVPEVPISRRRARRRNSIGLIPTAGQTVASGERPVARRRSTDSGDSVRRDGSYEPISTPEAPTRRRARRRNSIGSTTTADQISENCDRTTMGRSSTESGDDERLNKSCEPNSIMEAPSGRRARRRNSIGPIPSSDPGLMASSGRRKSSISSVLSSMTNPLWMRSSLASDAGPQEVSLIQVNIELLNFKKKQHKRCKEHKAKQMIIAPNEEDKNAEEDMPLYDFSTCSNGQYILNGMLPSRYNLLEMLTLGPDEADRPALYSPEESVPLDLIDSSSHPNPSRSGEKLAVLTYRDIVSFIKSKGDIRRLFATKKSLVAYVPPPGAGGALSAMAFLTIASQCPAAPLDPSYSEQDYKDAFKQLKPDIVVVFEPIDPQPVLRAAWATKCRCFLASPINDTCGLFTFRDVITNEEIPDFCSGGTIGEALVNPADGHALLLRTSGTTSTPKIVPLKMSGVVSNAHVIAKSLGLCPSDVALNAMPLFHIGGIAANLMSSIAAHASVILAQEFDADSFLRLLTTETCGIKPTWYSAVPTMHATITAAAKSKLSFAKGDLKHNLRFIRSGAAALPLALAQKMESVFGCSVVATYSMTEQMPISQPPTGFGVTDAKPRSVGRPVATSLCIVDTNLRPMPHGTGQHGEVCISGPSVFKGYRANRLANTKSFFFLGGMRWFRTGDMGYLDRDGFLFLTGRNKEMIKRGGEQINPLEVDEVCSGHPSIKMCVTFAIPDKLWGQRVGIAVVPNSTLSTISESEFQRELRRFLVTDRGLQEFKVPEEVVFVAEDQIPKTASKKVVRIGLAEKLGVKSRSDEMMEKLNDLKPVHISDALSGVRFLLAFAVLFTHVGDFGDSWNHARDFCLHMPAFFFMGGFILAVGSRNPVTGELKNFYGLRLAVLHPMYLVSLIFAVINFAMRCNPSNYIESFDFDQPPEEGENYTCQATLAEMPYGATMFTSLFVHIFALQAWPFSLPISWFLLSYAWFQSVYYFCILVFPWIHKSFHNRRRSKRGLWALMGAWTLTLYLVVSMFSIYVPLSDSKSETANLFALAAYLFPPGWLPCFSLGVGSYFLFALHRPNEKRRSWRWGVVTDTLSVGMLVVFLLFATDKEMTTVSSMTTGLDHRFFAYFLSRLTSPIIFTWMFGLAVGKGMTAKLLSGNFLVSVLAPASYNIYLFHQVVAEWYYRITRGDWWAYPKSFYWFSPKASPIDWWEFFIVALVTVVFSIILEFYINGWLVEKSTTFVRFISGSKTTVEHNDSVHDTIIAILKKTTGVDVTADTSLIDTGLSSMTTLLVVGDIKQRYKTLKLSARDVFSSKTVGGLISLIEGRLGNIAADADPGIDGFENDPGRHW